MEGQAEHSFTRYLSSKKTVDDRALNKDVFNTLKDRVAAAGSDPVLCLEIGAGIGTMVERALEWNLLKRAHYTTVDSEPDNIRTALERLPRWAEDNGYSAQVNGPNTIRIRRQDTDITVVFETADAFGFLAGQRGRKWDLLIANAFLDLVDIPAALPELFAAIRPGGLAYFTITFDGATIFEPEVSPDLDAKIQAAYHQTMDQRITDGKPSGDSRAAGTFSII